MILSYRPYYIGYILAISYSTVARDHKFNRRSHTREHLSRAKNSTSGIVYYFVRASDLRKITEGGREGRRKEETFPRAIDLHSRIHSDHSDIAKCV